MHLTVLVCGDGDVRLMNGSGSSLSSGRVELCLNNVYGTVCNDRWDEIDASVVCRQLNFPTSSKSLTFLLFSCSLLNNFVDVVVIRDGTVFGSRNGTVSVSGVVCGGAEDSLLQCSHILGSQDCEPAGVMCGSKSSWFCVS